MRLVALAAAVLAIDACAAIALAQNTGCFPDDTNLVLTLNLKQIRTSPLVIAEKDALAAAKRMLERLAGSQPLLGCLNEAGVDLFRDCERLSLAGVKAKEPGIGFIVVEADFTALKLKDRLSELAKIRPAALTIAVAGGATTYEIGAADGPCRFAALVDGNTLIVATTRELLTDGIARCNGSKASGMPGGLKALLDASDANQSFGVAASGPALAQLLHWASLPNAETAIAALKNGEGMSAGITLARDVQFHVAIHVREAEAAKQLADAGGNAVVNLGVLVQQKARDDARLIPAVEIVKGLKIESRGPVIRVQCKATIDAVAKLLHGLPAGSGAATGTSAANTTSRHRMPALDSAAAWQHLPRANPPLPVWARILIRPLPRTTAAMLELDYLHRANNPLGALLAAKLRWVAADALNCDYSRRSAEADLRKAGATNGDLQALAGPAANQSDDDRLALAFARKMTNAAYTVTDAEVDALVRRFGPDKVVAMVHTLAFANFHNRIVLALGIAAEEGAPLPPMDLQLDAERRNKIATPSRPPWSQFSRTDAGAGTGTALQWSRRSFADLAEAMEQQKRRAPRIPVPKSAPGGTATDSQAPASRIVWTNISMGYQPALTKAWFDCLRTFQEEAKLDRVFSNSLFWVVTRSNECFY
jgi:hypothetical protein